MKIKKYLFMLYVALSVFSFASIAQDNIIESISNAPRIESDNYSCADMARAVNKLRHLGKKRALSALRQYLDQKKQSGESDDKTKVLLICRLLFVNTNGWAFPRLGQPIPDVNWDYVKAFPAFPVALSDRVPFLLLRRYFLMGFTGDTPDKCITLCEKFELIDYDLSENGYEEAANKLIGDQAFKKLYTNTNDVMDMEVRIVSQARHLTNADKPPESQLK